MIVYKTGNLFESPRGSVLVHAVNAQGVWGRGIALDMFERYPIAFGHYKRLCDAMPVKKAGWALLLPEEDGYRVGCLCTSAGYGYKKDSPEEILHNTEMALWKFMDQLKSEDEVFSNRFNSGLFGVPWSLTEKVLDRVIGKRLWTVVDLSITD